jgi:2-polyprenyl-3-methyl-5-hydroxy-6-metoxy-1,4-benzoquinol methylase
MRFHTVRSIAPDVVAFHDGLANSWEDKYRGVRFAARLKILSELLPEQQIGKHWLDAGCGTGTLARWLAEERGAAVTAIDASQQMLVNAQSCPGVTYAHADVTHTGLPGEMFDGIICSSVIEYLESPRTALSEFARLLKSAGILLVSVPHAALSIRIPLKTIYWLTLPFGKLRLYKFLDYSLHSYSSCGLSRLLSSEGFLPTRVVDFGTIEHSIGVRWRLPGALLMSMALKP